MFEQRLSQDFEPFGSCPMGEDEMISGPRRELLDFISTVVDMVGPGATGYLTELWLDELAGLGYLPSPTSPDWRLVSLAASARLAGRLIEFRL
jgi:hypothetical protein